MRTDAWQRTDGGTRHPRPLLLALFAALALLCPAAPAGASSIVEAGQGAPILLNPSDHLLVASLVEKESKGTTEQDIEGPWSLWAEGKSTPLEPLNGGPETPSESALGSIEHQLFLYRLNAAGEAGGTSTISYFSEGKEHTVHRGTAC